MRMQPVQLNFLSLLGFLFKSLLTLLSPTCAIFCQHFQPLLSKWIFQGE